MAAFRISTEQTELDIALIHRFLAEQSTWAKNIPFATLERAMKNSLCDGGYVGSAQVAFARVISDYATFANLGDVFVLPKYRGKGYSGELMRAIIAHPNLQGLRRTTLATRNAHGLYAQFGFKAPLRPDSLMERYFPDAYNA